MPASSSPASSVATSFLAKLALPRDTDQLTILSGLAALAFLVSAGFCVWLLRPRGTWQFRMEGEKAIRVVLDARPQPSLARVHRGLAKQMDRSAVENQTHIDKMLQQFGWASAALGIEVVLWVADLVARRWT